jgi:HEAT repeat protein
MRDPIEVALDDIKSTKPKVRAAAADTLGQLASQEGVLRERPVVIEALRAALRDTEPMVRYNAALSLGEIKSLEAKHDLSDLLQDPDALVRQGSVIALGELGDRSMLPMLEGVLRSGSPEVRFQAIVSLVTLLGVEAKPYLKQTLQDSDGEVRAQAIGGLSDLLQTEPSAEAEVARMVRPFLLDLHPEARFEAALLLAKTKEPLAVPVLLEFAKDKAHGMDACEALGLLGDRSSIERLRKIWSGLFTSTAVSMRAAQAIIRLSPNDSIREREFLYKQAKKHTEFRSLGITYIAELAEDEGLFFLCKELQNEREVLALSMVDALVAAYPRVSQSAKGQILDSLQMVQLRHIDEETRNETALALATLRTNS